MKSHSSDRWRVIISFSRSDNQKIPWTLSSPFKVISVALWNEVTLQIPNLCGSEFRATLEGPQAGVLGNSSPRQNLLFFLFFSLWHIFFLYFHIAIKTMAFGTCEYLMEITLPPFYIKSISLFLQLALTLHFKHSLGIWYFIVPGLIHLRKISRFCDLVVGHFALMWILIMSDLKMVWDQNGLVSKPSKIPNFTLRGA